MSKLHYYKDIIINFLLTFFFGMRIEGEPINLEYGVEQPKCTVKPQTQPDQFSWMREHRVSSLHGVRQHVFL
jgi:hypothetical protein